MLTLLVDRECFLKTYEAKGLFEGSKRLKELLDRCPNVEATYCPATGFAFGYRVVDDNKVLLIIQGRTYVLIQFLLLLKNCY